jgi:hypothetical protein
LCRNETSSRRKIAATLARKNITPTSFILATTNGRIENAKKEFVKEAFFGKCKLDFKKENF